MKTTNHFARVALSVIAVAIVLGTAAPAMADAVKLTPPIDSPEPGASGTLNVKLLHGWRVDPWTGQKYVFYHDYLTLTCSGLNPSSVYYFSFFDFSSGEFDSWGYFVTDNHGRASLSMHSNYANYTYVVVVTNQAGDVVLGSE